MFQCVEDDEQSLTATVQRITIARFCDLTDEEVDQNHAYGGRKELEAAMTRAYAEESGFKADSIVTLIAFDVEGLPETKAAA